MLISGGLLYWAWEGWESSVGNGGKSGLSSVSARLPHRLSWAAQDNLGKERLTGPRNTEKWRYDPDTQGGLSLTLFGKDTVFTFVLLWRSRPTYSCSHRSQPAPLSLGHSYKSRVQRGYINGTKSKCCHLSPSLYWIQPLTWNALKNRTFIVLLVKGLGPRITSVVFSKQLLASSIIQRNWFPSSGSFIPNQHYWSEWGPGPGY